MWPEVVRRASEPAPMMPPRKGARSARGRMAWRRSHRSARASDPSRETASPRADLALPRGCSPWLCRSPANQARPRGRGSPTAPARDALKSACHHPSIATHAAILAPHSHPPNTRTGQRSSTHRRPARHATTPISPSCPRPARCATGAPLIQMPLATRAPQALRAAVERPTQHRPHGKAARAWRLTPSARVRRQAWA